MNLFSMEVEYQGYVEAYKAELIFHSIAPDKCPIEFIIPREEF